MAFNYSPKIVTDGLVLYLDAANPNSYVSGSNTWRDISRAGNNGIFPNVPSINNANGGSITFNGSNIYANVGNSPSLDLTTFTLATWFKSTIQTNQILMGKAYTISYYMNMGGGSFSLWTSGSTIGIPNIGLQDGNWHYVTATMVGTTKFLYADGILRTSGSGNIPATDSNSLYIGTSATVAIPFSGSIASAQVYNRALSATEVLQNYNATKTRFGLI